MTGKGKTWSQVCHSLAPFRRSSAITAMMSGDGRFCPGGTLLLQVLGRAEARPFEVAIHEIVGVVATIAAYL